jgi:hypothetical protein
MRRVRGSFLKGGPVGAVSAHAAVQRSTARKEALLLGLVHAPAPPTTRRPWTSRQQQQQREDAQGPQGPGLTPGVSVYLMRPMNSDMQLRW